MRHIKGFLFGLALAALGVPAHAAILYYSGEDTGFSQIGSVSVRTSSEYRTTFARASLAVNNTTVVADPPANRWQTPAFTASSNLWIHAQVDPAGGTFTTTLNQQSLLIRSPDGVVRLLLRQTGTAGTLKATKRDAAATLTDLATASATFSTSVAHQLDIHVIYGCTSGDVFQVWLDTSSIINVTGSSLCTNSATSLNQVDFAGIINLGITSDQTNWSEIIITDNDDTRSMALATLILQAAGNTQGWTPNTLANVNKGTINDASFVSDATGNVLSQWTVQTAAPTGIWGVKSVSIEGRLLASLTGPQNFDWSWRIGNANFLAGTTTALTNAFANYRLQQDTSPATSTTWGISEIFNTSTNQMNIGVKSLP